MESRTRRPRTEPACAALSCKQPVLFFKSELKLSYDSNSVYIVSFYHLFCGENVGNTNKTNSHLYFMYSFISKYIFDIRREALHLRFAFTTSNK